MTYFLNTPQEGNGYHLLQALNKEITPLVFFDPQYEKVAQVLAVKTYPLVYQTDIEINQFIQEIERVLVPNGYLCLWISKKVLLECRIHNWLKGVKALKIVDLLIWKKANMGFGWRFRNQAEFLVLIQKHPYHPNFADRSFSNVWTEAITNKSHPHQKPLELLKKLILVFTKPHELIIDPCAGSFMVLTACQKTNRNFLGCDLTIKKIQKLYEKK